MYFRVIWNDIQKSKLITIVTMIFIAAAAMLVSLGAILTVNLSGSIDNLMAQAKTPHFMQMHTGDIDKERLSDFVNQNQDVDAFQILEFLNIDGAKIIIGNSSLADSTQDNGLCTQSKKFDYLLDLNGNVIKALDGEIYVPVFYKKNNNVKLGDEVTICGKDFSVAGFLRDSQMNSSLCGSKRFLVSENDYIGMKSLGSLEYLIEFRLKNLSNIGSFEVAYTSAGLEANGPTVTYSLFKMLNIISDGIMIGEILLVSFLVVVIAFMCIRFTLLAKIEDDYREIGIMKAIGLRLFDIKKIYLVKYAAVALTGCVLGYGLSFAFRHILLENIKQNFGEGKNTYFAPLFGIAGVLLVFSAIMLYVNGVLKSFRKISAAQAIRDGVSQEKLVGAKYFCLSQNKLLTTNIFMGINDVLHRKKLYVTMLVVFILSVFIIIVPQNLYNTISSDSFIKYMGIGSYDMRIQLNNSDATKVSDIKAVFENDESISKYVALTTRAYKVMMVDGTQENLKVELGDNTVFPINYSMGRAPATEAEIALSVLSAKGLGKNMGDTIKLVINGHEKNLTICGIYSDVTNGGKTAKAIFDDNSEDIIWCIISAKITDKSLVSSKVSEYAKEFDYARVTEVGEFVSQTFGSIVSAVGKVTYVAVGVSLLIAMLITLLFMKMLITKDRYSIAILKAFGFTNSDITRQYVTQSIFVLIIGIVFGTILANTLGKVLVGVLISGRGVTSFQFIINPMNTYVVYPLILLCVVLFATMIGISGVGKVKISENIKE